MMNQESKSNSYFQSQAHFILSKYNEIIKHTNEYINRIIFQIGKIKGDPTRILDSFRYNLFNIEQIITKIEEIENNYKFIYHGSIVFRGILNEFKLIEEQIKLSGLMNDISNLTEINNKKDINIYKNRKLSNSPEKFILKSLRKKNRFLTKLKSNPHNNVEILKTSSNILRKEKKQTESNSPKNKFSKRKITDLNLWKLKFISRLRNLTDV